MWLINTDTFELERWDNYEKGSYAILSHTWEDDEVSFQEFQDLESARKKRGFDKIERTVLMARDRNLKFAWVDTCCIDKTSSAELSEAVNSMYKWYDDSAVCFVHLSDLYSKLDTQYQNSRHFSQPIPSRFKDCRWFTRGWTLQELIAPKDVKFYDAEWIYIGNKIDLMGEIEKITKVPRRVIQSFGHGNWFHQCLYKESIAYRMSWASSRETTRVEDTAYCLLGIFGINMPLLYGEGDKAFIRLQEEICKQTTDMSLFAWKAKSELPSGGPAQEFRGLFANHPREFSDDYSTLAIGSNMPYLGEITITNRGIRLDKMPLWVSQEHGLLMNLDCERWVPNRGVSTGFRAQHICLIKVVDSFARCNPSVLVETPPKELGDRFTPFLLPQLYIKQQLSPTDLMRIQKQMILSVEFEGEAIKSYTAWPLDLWDPHRCTFLLDRKKAREYAIKIEMEGTNSYVEDFIILLDWYSKICSIFRHDDPEFHVLDGLIQQGDLRSSLTLYLSRKISKLRHEGISDLSSNKRGEPVVCLGKFFKVSVNGQFVGINPSWLRIESRIKN